IYPVPRLLGDIWLHPNVRTWTHGPYRIALGQLGIACYTTMIPAAWPPRTANARVSSTRKINFPRDLTCRCSESALSWKAGSSLRSPAMSLVEPQVFRLRFDVRDDDAWA